MSAAADLDEQLLNGDDDDGDYDIDKEQEMALLGDDILDHEPDEDDVLDLCPTDYDLNESTTETSVHEAGVKSEAEPERKPNIAPVPPTKIANKQGNKKNSFVKTNKRINNVKEHAIRPEGTAVKMLRPFRKNKTVLINPRFQGTVHVNGRLPWANATSQQHYVNPWTTGNNENVAQVMPQFHAAPHQNILPPQQNMVPPQQNIMPPLQNILGAQQNMLGPQQNMLGPQQNMLPPQQNIMPPPQNMLGPQPPMLPPQQNMVPPSFNNQYLMNAPPQQNFTQGIPNAFQNQPHMGNNQPPPMIHNPPPQQIQITVPNKPSVHQRLGIPERQFYQAPPPPSPICQQPPPPFYQNNGQNVYPPPQNQFANNQEHQVMHQPPPPPPVKQDYFPNYSEPYYQAYPPQNQPNPIVPNQQLPPMNSQVIAQVHHVDNVPPTNEFNQPSVPQRKFKFSQIRQNFPKRNPNKQANKRMNSNNNKGNRNFNQQGFNNNNNNNNNNRPSGKGNFQRKNFDKNARPQQNSVQNKPSNPLKTSQAMNTDEDEDEETRQYRLKIEEQKKRREEIVRQKEERRKQAATENETPSMGKFVPRNNPSIQQANNAQYTSPNIVIMGGNFSPNRKKFKKNRTNVFAVAETIKNACAIQKDNGQSPFWANRTVLAKEEALLETQRVLVKNLSSATNVKQLMKMGRNFGEVQNLHLDKNERQATIHFKSVSSAHAFYKKYQRYMLDLSMIQATLLPDSGNDKADQS